MATAARCAIGCSWRTTRALALERGRPGETYCIGGRGERRNLHVAEAICDALGRAAPLPNGRPQRDFIAFVANRPGHDRCYAMNPAKAERELG